MATAKNAMYEKNGGDIDKFGNPSAGERNLEHVHTRDIDLNNNVRCDSHQQPAKAVLTLDPRIDRSRPDYATRLLAFPATHSWPM
jgi:hypothetical protein